MNKKNKILIIITAFILFAFLIPYIVYKVRSPILIISEEYFINYYGIERIKNESKQISNKLFRPVLTVPIANEAGDDLTALAVGEFSSNPYCVLFPLRFAGAARFYRDRNPQSKVIILEGRYPENSSPSNFGIGDNKADYFIYKTDIERDFYKAAGAALLIDNKQNGKIIVFITPNLLLQARTAFFEGLNDFKNLFNSESIPEAYFYTDFSHYYDITDLSCIIYAGIGTEFLEKKTDIPSILISWLNPLYVPDSTAVIIEDSPWAQVEKAVKMLENGEENGKIPSKFHFINMQKFDSKTLRKMIKTW